MLFLLDAKIQKKYGDLQELWQIFSMKYPFSMHKGLIGKEDVFNFG